MNKKELIGKTIYIINYDIEACDGFDFETCIVIEDKYEVDDSQIFVKRTINGYQYESDVPLTLNNENEIEITEIFLDKKEALLKYIQNMEYDKEHLNEIIDNINIKILNAKNDLEDIK